MERKSFLLRIDPQLWQELEGWAQNELRSVNGQIEFILREAVQKRRAAKTLPPSSEVNSPEKTDENAGK